jgi:hypothetical protein
MLRSFKTFVSDFTSESVPTTHALKGSPPLMVCSFSPFTLTLAAFLYWRVG